jgi:hypothetical protein
VIDFKYARRQTARPQYMLTLPRLQVESIKNIK